MHTCVFVWCTCARPPAGVTPLAANHHRPFELSPIRKLTDVPFGSRCATACRLRKNSPAHNYDFGERKIDVWNTGCPVRGERAKGSAACQRVQWERAVAVTSAFGVLRLAGAPPSRRLFTRPRVTGRDLHAQRARAPPLLPPLPRRPPSLRRRHPGNTLVCGHVVFFFSATSRRPRL